MALLPTHKNTLPDPTERAAQARRAPKWTVAEKNTPGNAPFSGAFCYLCPDMSAFGRTDLPISDDPVDHVDNNDFYKIVLGVALWESFL